MALNKSEQKILKNLIIVAPKKDGTINIFEKKYNTTTNFTAEEAAAMYLKKLMEEEK